MGWVTLEKRGLGRQFGLEENELKKCLASEKGGLRVLPGGGLLRSKKNRPGQCLKGVGGQPWEARSFTPNCPTLMEHLLHTAPWATGATKAKKGAHEPMCTL